MKTPTIEFASYTRNRRPEWQILTRIVCKDGQRSVWKTALTDAAALHIAAILENHAILARIYGEAHIPACRRLDDKTIEIGYVRGISLEECLRHDIIEGDESSFQARIRWYEQEILSPIPERGDAPSFEGFGDFRDPARTVDYGTTFDNIICTEGKGTGSWQIIGCEWLCCGLSRDDLFWHAIRRFQSGIHGVPEERMDGYVQRACRESIRKETPERLAMEHAFQERILSDPLAKIKKPIEDPAQRFQQELAAQTRRADGCEQEIAAIRATRGYRMLERIRGWRKHLS